MTPQRLRNIFASERARFAAVFPRVKGTRLYLVDEQPVDARDYARAVIGRRPCVVFLLRALRLPERNVVALVRHELSHIADGRNPTPGAEQRADDIAAFVTGQLIRYDRRDVQTVGRGRYPRPQYLHR